MTADRAARANCRRDLRPYFCRYARQRTENILDKADHDPRMNTQLDMFRRPRWVAAYAAFAAFAAIALAATSMAAILGWAPAAAETPVEVYAPEPTPDARARCTDCGVIVSTREIDNSSGETAPKSALNLSQKLTPHSPRRLEITVRMRDGSRRVIDDVGPANWRVGERLTLIGGVNPPIRVANIDPVRRTGLPIKDAKRR